MPEIIKALAYTGATLGAVTAIHFFLWGIIWANDTLKYRIAKHRGLGPIFRILFLHHEETLKNHEQEIHDFIHKLERDDKRKIES